MFSNAADNLAYDRPDLADDRLFLTEDHCRAAFGRNRICGLLASECTRAGHADSVKGPAGAYVSLGPLRSNSTVADGEAGSYVRVPNEEDDLLLATGGNQASQPEVATVQEGDEEDGSEDAPGEGMPYPRGASPAPSVVPSDAPLEEPHAEGGDQGTVPESPTVTGLLARRRAMEAEVVALADAVADREAAANRYAAENEARNAAAAQNRAQENEMRAEIDALSETLRRLQNRMRVADQRLQPALPNPARPPRPPAARHVPGPPAQVPGPFNRSRRPQPVPARIPAALSFQSDDRPLTFPLGHDRDQDRYTVYGQSTFPALMIFKTTIV